MKTLIAVIMLLRLSCVQAQNLVSYPTLVKTFFSLYAASDDYTAHISFAKKKTGWYVQVVDQSESKVISEKEFWPMNGQPLLDLSSFEKQSDPADAQKNIEKYLNTDFDWYGYERCRYYGYPGWEDDMIKDFGDQKNLSDTLLEGLARAYSYKSHSFLWNQMGSYNVGNDPLTKLIGRLEIPSPERIEKAEFYLNKGIEAYSPLIRQNPAYVCKIGNVSLKKFNETMLAYHLMQHCMQDGKAAAFLTQAELAESYVQQAKNYLNSCDKNAILITYGDNDTYQLWYVQQKLNYRKDVIVLNSSLLGSPAYLNFLKVKKIVNFKTAPAFYGVRTADVSYFKEKKPATASYKSFDDLLAEILAGKHTITAMTGENFGAYASKNVTLKLDPVSFNKISALKTKATGIRIRLNDYLLMNDLAMLDIVNSNINTRPIYFTASATGFFDGELFQQGIVYRLFPVSSAAPNSVESYEAKRIEKFIDSIYKPVIDFSWNGAKNFSFDGNNKFFELYSKLFELYEKAGNKKRMIYWIERLLRIYPNITKENMPGAYGLVVWGVRASFPNTRQYIEAYAEYLYDKYLSPSATNGYLSKEDLIDQLQSLNGALTSVNLQSDMIDDLLEEVN